jgi:AbrB family looped-hinge helix DNA binding protein
MDQIEITRVSSRGQIVIPISMRNDLKEGDKLIIIKKGDEIILKKPQKIISETALLSEKSLARNWSSPEDEKAFAYLQDEI